MAARASKGGDLRKIPSNSSSGRSESRGTCLSRSLVTALFPCLALDILVPGSAISW